MQAWPRFYAQWGNRIAVGGGASQSVTLQQQPGAPAGVPNNRIATFNSIGYAYDASGNLTSDGAHTYQYDGAGRIAGVDATGAAYSYDSANRRLKKVVGSTTTYYIWEGAQVIAEYSNAAAGAGGTSYYLADRLSTRMTTETNGAFKGTQDHLPFGEESGSGTSGTTEKHRFTNYERDAESNTDYAINRQYAMNTGRFMRPDPVGGSIGNPQSLNRYSYTLNDPANLTDPLGLESNPYIWDASVRGPGVYLDGFEVMPEQWEMIFGLVAMGAADVLMEGVVRNRRDDGWAIPYTDEEGVHYQDVSWLFELNQLIAASLQVVDDCQRLANMAGQIANSSNDVQGFMDKMASTFTAAKDSTISEMRRTQNMAPPANFGDTGFKAQFRDGGDQVRHFVAGLVAGYRLGQVPALLVMNEREHTGSAGVNNPDMALNAVSTAMGSGVTPRSMVVGRGGITQQANPGYKNIADRIRKEVCDP